jgi:membrane protein
VPAEPDESRLARLWTLTKRVVKGLFTHHAFDHAGTMSFYFFLGSIPLLVFVGLLVGGVVQKQGAEELAAPFYKAMPAVAADLFRNELRAIGDASATSLAPVSLLGFLWLTTNGVHNLMDVFEILVQARPRPWLRQRLIAFLWVMAFLVVVVVATWTLLWVNGVTTGLGNATRIPVVLRTLSEFLARGWQRFGVLVVFSGLATVGLALFYRTSVAHPRGVRRRVWPGTFVALALWTLVSWGFGTYVKTIAHYAVYYGSLATVAVVLLWLYLTSLSLVVGAEINAQLEGVRDPPPS